jgi:hypothetical protein
MNGAYASPGSERDFALTMPDVTVFARLYDEPIAITQSPTSTRCGLPVTTTGRSSASILISATSESASVPTTFFDTVVKLENAEQFAAREIDGGDTRHQYVLFRFNRQALRTAFHAQLRQPDEKHASVLGKPMRKAGGSFATISHRAGQLTCRQRRHAILDADDRDARQAPADGERTLQ